MKKLKDFFEKRKEAEVFHKQIMEQLHVLTKEIQVEKNVLDALCKEVKQNGTDISRHDMALEDFLELLEETKEDTEHIKKQEEERESLLGLITVYQEHFWNMRRYARINDDRWYQQLLLVAQKMQEQMHSCGIAVIEEEGGMVNYELHEAIEVKDTDDINKDRMIAAVYRPGYLYQGKVRQKASVSVYRLCRGERIDI